MSILHFSGKFQFELPFENNRVEYDYRDDKYQITPDFENGSIKYYKLDRIQKLLKSDPSDYFKFKFKDCTIKTVTNMSNTVMDKNTDCLIDSNILMNGFLTDISPHLEYGRLYPIIDTDSTHGLEIWANNDKLIMESHPANIFDPDSPFLLQSDLYKNIRTKDIELSVYRPYFGYSAYFESLLKNIRVYDESSSPFLNNVVKNQDSLYLYFHTCQFKTTNNKDKLPENEGTIYGYIGPYSDIFDNANIQLKQRRLIVSDVVEPRVKNAFSIFATDIERTRFSINNDHVYPLEGSYDILLSEGTIVIKYLHFIPFVKYENNELHLPDEFNYNIYFTSIISLSKIPIVENLKIDTEKTKKNGGILVFRLPDLVSQDPASYFLNIDVTKNGETYTFMKEPKLDYILQSERGLILKSGNSSSLKFCICKDHRKIKDYPYKISMIEELYSPIVGYFEGTLKVDIENDPILDSEGKVTVIEKEENSGSYDITIPIKSLLFKNLKIYDPFQGKPLELSKVWDRYFGNYLRITLESLDDNLLYEKRIPVRVLHYIELSKIRPKDIRYSEHIRSLFEYYTRYFPLIHAKKTDEFGEMYLETVFDFNNKDDVINKIDKVINFLNLDDDKKNKMPRSRDFHGNGMELIKLWRDNGFK